MSTSGSTYILVPKDVQLLIGSAAVSLLVAEGYLTSIYPLGGVVLVPLPV